MADYAGLILAGGAGYFLGSIPFGLIVGRRLGNVDVRNYGSGNIGTTNVLRVLGPAPAAVVLGFDLGKGALSALLGSRLAGSWGASIAAAMAVVGHSFPVWLGFRGGKSVATAAGGLLVLAPKVLLIEIALFVAVVATTRYVSLGSILAAAAVPFLFAATGSDTPGIAYAAVAGGLVIVRHRTNIRRLLSGTENRLGKKAGPG
ncbi:MAG: glycerol-3-phosphate 1-O-acyltransferase PlsY [Firmicutes bacterium]|nr:glycerol-3-phosphate 1-O-acyltransferase PlsY [Bacillota bacterium]